MPHLGQTALVAIGDSFTYNDVYGVPLADHYPHKVAEGLDYAITPFNYGVAGDSTSACLARAAAIAADGVPEICIIWAGTNNALNSTTVSTDLVQIANTIGSPRTIIVGNHFMNFSTNGDTIKEQLPRWRRLRLKQKKAARLANIPYMDLHGYMRQILIENPALVGNDLLWNVDTGNAHLNALGEMAVATCLLTKFKALGWHLPA